jgi:hypothetical protein
LVPLTPRVNVRGSCRADRHGGLRPALRPRCRWRLIRSSPDGLIALFTWENVDAHDYT